MAGVLLPGASYAGASSTAATAADLSAQAAAASATAAANSATTAATSATSATGSAGTAGTAATNAAASASAAATSATAAATSEANALAIYGSTAAMNAAVAAAATSETNAATSATNAATSATAAGTSATNAATSATNASTSATSAINAAANAAISQAASAGDAATAVTAQTAAAASATAAATSATSAATSATNAAADVVSAAASAATASTAATTSGTNAAAAATSATNAATSATAAGTSATNAATSAANALASESAAAISETNALAIYGSTAAVNAAVNAAAASATSASASASSAGTAAASAGTSETNANNSAVSAAASAAAASAVVFGGSIINGDIRLSQVVATLPPITIVDHCFHLAKDDTDKGAWRKRKGQSWRSEARTAGKYLGSVAVTTTSTNTAALLSMINAGTAVVGDYLYASGTGTAFVEITGITGTAPSATAYALTLTYRAGKEDYPTNALVTAEAGRVIIWDLDGAVPSMWMVFISVGSAINTFWFAQSGIPAPVTSVSAMNQNIIFGLTGGVATSSDGLCVISFSADDLSRRTTLVGRYGYGVKIADRLNGVPFPNSFTSTVVSGQINDVAVTVLPDAPLDEFGMPVPTIAVGTAGGVSVIKHDGNVWDITYGGQSSTFVKFYNNRIFAGVFVSPNTYLYSIDIPSADNTANPPTGSNAYYAGAPYVGGFTGTATANKDNVFYGGGSSGLSVLAENTSSRALGIKANITSTYNTGYMVGDIRRCFLANSQTADRSVKAGTLTVVGTPTETVNAGGRNVYSGFSAANYFQEASHADWNALGTGDFSIIMSGVKWGTGAGTARDLLSVGDGVSTGSFRLRHGTTNAITFQIYTGVAFSSVVATTATFTDTSEHTVEVKRGTFGGVANTIQILIDGVVLGSAVSALTISNATGFLRIGESQGGTAPLTGGQVSCVRISATAPTAEQSKFIAAQENALNGGQACLLSNSSSVSRLDYKASEGLLEVVNGTATDYFNGLKRVASVTTTSGITGGNNVPKYALLRSGTTNKFWGAERNISSELQEQIQTTPRTQQYLFTTPAATTTQALPKGFKAQGVAFNTTDGTILGTYTQTFDGFIYTIGGLTASKAYQINLIEVL